MTITNDYSDIYGYGSSVNAGGIIGGILAFYGIFMLIMCAISVIMIIAQWKIFTKNNKPGWYSIIPFLNTWTLFEIVGIKGWWSLIPGANVVFMYIANYKLPLQMGKSKTLAILNIFFPYVIYPILAFSKDKVQQANVYGAPNAQYQQPQQNMQYQQPVQQTPSMQQPMQQNYANTTASVTPASTVTPSTPVTPVVPVAPSTPVAPAAPTAPVTPVGPTVEPMQNVANRCPNCNTEITPGSLFCQGCGRSTNQ